MVIGYAAYYFYKMPKYNEGELAPDFTATIKTGETITLSSLEGNYILLDFWGSWCGPCRKENPKLVKLFSEFHKIDSTQSINLEIVSVAIEFNPQGWEKAIVSDGLVWKNHIYEKGRFQSPIAKMYGVKEIPTKYLIDPEGKIIFTNPSFDQLRKVLSDNLH